MEAKALQEPIVEGGIRSINFFNGRLLTGQDLTREQAARREADRRVAQAVGDGVAYGLEVSASAKDGETGPVITVQSGLAVSRSGQTLYLKDPTDVLLGRRALPRIGVTRTFDDCGGLKNGTYAAHPGIYLLTIAPAEDREGKALTHALDDAAVPCNTDTLVEGVQFRLLPLDPLLDADTLADTGRLRNRIAYQCFGADDLLSFIANPFGSGGANYGLLAQIAGKSLTECDVPLAVISLQVNIDFIDMWSVRRRVAAAVVVPGANADSHADPAGPLGRMMLSDASMAVAEAMFFQFQGHIAAIQKESGAAATLAAGSRFRYLPPAGYLPTGSGRFDWRIFLGEAYAQRRIVALNPDLARAVLMHSLTQAPVLLARRTPRPQFHVYQVAGHTDYVLFARSALSEVIAEDVYFDNAVCNLQPLAPESKVDDVQAAIEALWAECRGCCTLTVVPRPGWEKVFDRIGNHLDAVVCFQPGEYPLNAAVEIRAKGNLHLHGAGAATRITIRGSEAALRFIACKSVLVRYLSIDGSVAPGRLPDPPSGRHARHTNLPTDFLNGLLTFLDCPSVEVDHVAATAAHGVVKGASCITVRNTNPSANTSVRIERCTLAIGNAQIGLLVVNVARVHVENNVLRLSDKAPDGKTLLGDARVQRLLSRQLISRARYVVGNAAVPDKGQYNAVVSLSDRLKVYLTVHPQLTTRDKAHENAWERALKKRPLPGIDTPQKLIAVLRASAQQIVASAGKTVLTLADGDIAAEPKVSGVYAGIVKGLAGAGAQGIVVGGAFADDVRILNNSVGGVFQGIHVGLSYSEKARGIPATAGSVLISGNTVNINLPSFATRERHGIFVGNCASLIIDANRLVLARYGDRATAQPIEGVRLYGYFGERLVVRANHLDGFNAGVRLRVPNHAAIGKTPRWLITDNIAVRALLVVDVPENVKVQVRGLTENFS